MLLFGSNAAGDGDEGGGVDLWLNRVQFFLTVVVVVDLESGLCTFTFFSHSTSNKRVLGGSPTLT